MIVASAADTQKGYYHHLKTQVKRQRIPFIFEELRPFSWRRLLLWEQDFAKRHPTETIVFVDAWDFLMVGTREELEAITGGVDILYHAEARCWPEPHKLDFYPPSPTPYRFVNGTGPAGRGEAIADAISYGMAHFPITGDESSIFADNDQRFFTDLFLRGFGQIDYFSRLSVQLNAVGLEEFHIERKRLHLLPTDSHPIFIHLNGASKHTHGDTIDALL